MKFLEQFSKTPPVLKIPCINILSLFRCLVDDRPSPIDLKWVYLSVLVAYPAFCIWVNFMALKEASVLAENLETNKKK